MEKSFWRKKLLQNSALPVGNRMKNDPDWWKDIQPGDMVCDCRFKHLKVAKVEREIIRIPKYSWYQYVPNWIPDWLDEILYRLYSFTPKKEV